jgi:RNA polymerase sigma factor (sigma-70 family)
MTGDAKAALLQTMVEIDRAVLEATRQALSTERGRKLFAKKVRAWIKDPVPGHPAIYNARRFARTKGHGQKYNTPKAMARIESALGNLERGSPPSPRELRKWADARPHVDLLEACARAGGSKTGWYFCGLLRYHFHEAARLALPIVEGLVRKVARPDALDDMRQDAVLGVLHGVRSFSPQCFEGWDPNSPRAFGAIWSHLNWQARAAIGRSARTHHRGWVRKIGEHLDAPLRLGGGEVEGETHYLRHPTPPTQFDEAMKAEANAKVLEAIKALHPRARDYALAVLEDRGATSNTVGKRHGVTGQRIRQHWTEALRVLRKRLGPDLRP